MDADDLKDMWQQQLEKSQQAFADWWRAQAAFWQTVSDIQGGRGAALVEWWQNLPENLKSVSGAGNWPEAMAALVKWQQQTWMSSWHLASDTQQQRAYLWKEWLKLAQRNGWNIPGLEEPDTDTTPTPGKSSFYAANPHLKPQATPARPAPAPKTAPQPAPKAEAAPASAKTSPDYVPMPAGIFIPGPGHSSGSSEQAAGRSEAEPQSPKPEAQSSANPEPARNAAQAATLAGATSARRSVVASHRSRSGRRPR